MTNLHSDKIKTANLHTTTNHIYTNTKLRKLLVPIIIEQLLASLMGTVDTMMVSNVGSAAISAVSLVELNQYPCHTGTFSACRRWCDSLFTVSGKSQYKRCPPCCKTGIFCHGISVCTFICFLSDNKKATASCHFWCC